VDDVRILGWLASLTGDRTLAFERPAWLLLPLVVAPLLWVVARRSLADFPRGQSV